jgi:hypothetical protein
MARMPVAMSGVNDILGISRTVLLKQLYQIPQNLKD